MLYAAYGSNLNVAQMRTRCPDAVPLGSIMLTNTRLVFRGVADVIREDGATCPVGLWRITPRCEAALDRYEGYRPEYPDSGMYRKEIVEVAGLPDGETEIMLYCMNSTGIYPPSEGYYQCIVQGYKDFEMDRAPLRLALKHSHDEKRPSHIERKRTRRMGRPALQPRPQRKPEPQPEPQRKSKKQRKAERRAVRASDPGAFHDPWANVDGGSHRRKVMNLDQWLRDRKSSGDRY